MIAYSPRFLHPIDQLKVLAGEVVTPHEHRTTGFVQIICGTCKTPITTSMSFQINGMASCHDCSHDHRISYNVCKRPFKTPHPRKLADRSPKPDPALGNGFGQASGFVTTFAATEHFIKNPNSGL